MGEDLGGNQTFRDVLMKPKLRKWEGDVKNDEAKKQMEEGSQAKTNSTASKRIAVIREQYGGRKDVELAVENGVDMVETIIFRLRMIL